MDTEGIKRRVREAENRLAHGDSEGWLAAMDDDVRFTIMGRTSWSRTYEGKRAVREELLAPLASRFAGPYRRTVHRLLADDGWVVAQCRGEVATVDGDRYDNDYCLLYRVDGDLIVEIVEYGDTALLDTVLGDRVR